MRAKEYLVSIGALPKGKENARGRLSLEHKALIEKAVADGVSIDGYAVKNETNKTTGATEPVISRTIHSTNAILDVPDEAKNEHLWAAFVDGKEIGMRTPCIQCSQSLTYCRCEKARVWIDFDRSGVVSFSPRKNALPKNRW